MHSARDLAADPTHGGPALSIASLDNCAKRDIVGDNGLTEIDEYVESIELDPTKLAYT